MSHGEMVVLAVAMLFVAQCRTCQHIESMEHAAWQTAKATERAAAALERAKECPP